MGIPLLGNFDLAGTVPLDSRTTWTGTFNNLNSIPNRYPGLTCYINGDQNLYVYQGSDVWEKVVTTNIDATTQSIDFTITSQDHGKVIYADSVFPMAATLQGNFQEGFNVTIVQMGLGQVTIQSSNDLIATLRNRLNFNRTAGQYAVVSILRQGSTNNFLLYGDLI